MPLHGSGATLVGSSPSHSAIVNLNPSLSHHHSARSVAKLLRYAVTLVFKEPHEVAPFFSKIRLKSVPEFGADTVLLVHTTTWAAT